MKKFPVFLLIVALLGTIGIANVGQAQSQTEIIHSFLNVTNSLDGSGEGATIQGYAFELFISAYDVSLPIQPDDISLSAMGVALTIDEIRPVEIEGETYQIRAYGYYDATPILGDYSVTLGSSDPFYIGNLEDYPDGAPEMVYPRDGQSIAATQPTFQWEEFRSTYVDTSIDPSGYEIVLRFPDGDSYSVWPIPGDQTALNYDNSDWEPTPPPDLSPGNVYSLTIHSLHDVAPPGFVFEHHRTISFGVSVAVEVDIKPFRRCNLINRWGRGFISVAILSDGDFDPTSEVDRTSLTFGRTGDEDSRWFCLRRGWDVDRTGYRDLVCLFWNKKAGFQCGDEEGILKGQTKDGTPIEGSDSVRIVPCR